MRGIFSHCFENWLEIGRRASDYAEDLARGSLLFQRLCQIVVLSLEFIEQSDILNRNYCLISKGLYELDLSFSKRFDENAPNGNGSQWYFLSQHGNH